MSEVVNQDGILAQLRAETSGVHHRLERDLALLDPPPRRERFTLILQRFLGFYSVWEPALRSSGLPEAIVRGRERQSFLLADLKALDASAVAPGRCEAARGLCSTPARAAGSLYVIEGSTLGGQVIGRSLQGTDWLPAAGLTYFHPYGAQTGARWRELLQWLDATFSTGDRDAVVAGASETFEVLHGWLTPGLPA